jgi:hypothetical protein
LHQCPESSDAAAVLERSEVRRDVEKNIEKVVLGPVMLVGPPVSVTKQQTFALSDLECLHEWSAGRSRDANGGCIEVEGSVTDPHPQPTGRYVDGNEKHPSPKKANATDVREP